MSLGPAWEPWAGLMLREVEFAHHGCPAGSVAEVASVPRAEHREDGGIVLADGFRQPVCYGVEITEYPLVSGQSAGSAEGIGPEFLDGQTVAEVAAFRLWGNWGRCGLVRLARGGGGREWSCASGGRPAAFWST
jgi:hypothetical protein